MMVYWRNKKNYLNKSGGLLTIFVHPAAGFYIPHHHLNASLHFNTGINDPVQYIGK